MRAALLALALVLAACGDTGETTIEPQEELTLPTVPTTESTLPETLRSTTLPPTTLPPATVPTTRPTTTATTPPPTSGCHPSYRGACVPADASDVDCEMAAATATAPPTPGE